LIEFKIGTAAGNIDEGAKIVTVRVPYAETANQVVSWTVSPGAAVRLKTAEDISGTSVYTVAAANGDTQDYTVKRIAEGQGGIVIRYPDADSISGGEVSISKTETPNATLTASLGYESYEWLVDGESKGNTYKFTVNAAEYAPGKHYVSVELMLAGVPYSAETFFIVE
jgi:hypothetical protein